ncbi:hypothetical protein HY449_01535 [Candidatus Pacearchaeota archaeon]|nr:hypothetical protein [Candidatus Pacearchaeota archaeon]
MEEAVKLIVGVLVLLLGFPIGTFLAKTTKEELKAYQKWFKLAILISAVGSLVSVILRNDVLLFTFLFIIIVTSGSLRGRK